MTAPIQRMPKPGEPTHNIFGKLDPQWCLEQCKYIVNELPRTEKSNASGKFFDTYEQWKFHKSSNLPIMQKFREELEKHLPEWEKIYGRKPRLDFFILAYTKDSTKEMSIWHTDKYFYDGQFHLTVQGNANIETEKETIFLDNGTLWYLNGTTYKHKINANKEPIERYELCCPIYQQEKHIDVLMSCVKGDNKLVYANEDFKKMANTEKKGVEEAVKRGTASSVLSENKGRHIANMSEYCD